MPSRSRTWCSASPANAPPHRRGPSASRPGRAVTGSLPSRNPDMRSADGQRARQPTLQRGTSIYTNTRMLAEARHRVSAETRRQQPQPVRSRNRTTIRSGRAGLVWANGSVRSRRREARNESRSRQPTTVRGQRHADPLPRRRWARWQDGTTSTARSCSGFAGIGRGPEKDGAGRCSRSGRHCGRRGAAPGSS